MNITVYAVAGLVASTHYVPGQPPHTPGAFQPNNIIDGITASCQVTIGTTTGVVDPTQHIQALLDTSVGTLAGIFGVLPLGVDNARLALLSVDTGQLRLLAATAAILATGAVTTSKLAALVLDAAALGTSAVTSTKIANLAVGTAAIANAAVTSLQVGSAAIGTTAIQTGAITNALIGNLAVGTANIQLLAVGTAQLQNLAVTNAKITDLDVSKLNAGVINVSGLGTAAIAVKDSGSSARMSIFAGALSALHTGGALGVSLGAGAGGDAGLELTNSAGGNDISISTFAPGIFIRGVQVLSTRVATTPVTLSDVISVLQHHGFSN